MALPPAELRFTLGYEYDANAVAFLMAAVAYYKSLGITVLRVMTDNGSCYRSPACRRLKLKHIRTKPYTDSFNADNRVVAFLKDNQNNRIVLTRGTEKAPFRVTSFEGNEPTGHRDYNSLAEAAKEFSRSYDIQPPLIATREAKRSELAANAPATRRRLKP